MSRHFPKESAGYEFSPAVKKLTRLTLQFSKAVAAEQKDKSENVLFSSYNALTALSMTAAGASNNTREQMAQTLFGGSAASLDTDIEELATLNTDILAANAGKVTLKTANAIWVNADYSGLNPAYQSQVEGTFGAKVDSQSFRKPGLVDEVNQWGSDATEKMITEFIKEIDPDGYAILASALYFKGDWTDKFDKTLTKDSAFTQDGGDITDLMSTPTMHRDFGDDRSVVYQDGGDYEAVAMTYGKKDVSDYKNLVLPSMRLVLVRPKDDNLSARDWMAQQDANTIPYWLEPDAYEGAEGSIELPRMEMDQKHDLKPVLQSMGVSDAFDGLTADFSRMSGVQNGLHISAVSQKIVFKTNEEGSEAAAVTVVEMGIECCAPMPVHIDFKLNRSFVFAMQDIKTGAVLFTGVVNKPNKDMKQIAQVCPQF